MSAMFCTSRTACAPRRTASSGLEAADFASVGLNSRQCEKRERQPAVICQFSPLMSWMTADAGQDSSVGTTRPTPLRSEEHTSELQSLMRISYAVFCLKKKNQSYTQYNHIDKNKQ